MRLALWLYWLLTWLLPARIRRRQGAQMRAQLFEQLVGARAGGQGSVLRCALQGCLDLVLRIPYEHVRRVRRAQLGEHLMLGSLGFEIRQGLRMLRRQPGTSALVVAMLALGIAANTVVFTFVNTVFVRPLPWEEPAQLVYLNERAPKWNLDFTGINFPDFAVWREGARAFEAMALYSEGAFNVAEGGVAERLLGVTVTHDYLAVLRIKPVLGRGFTAQEDGPEGERVALISTALWRSRFAGSESVLGRTLHINSIPHSIVGVLPPAAVFPNEAQIWVPLRGDRHQNWQSYSFDGIARLRAGVTIEAAQRDLHRAQQPIWEQRDRERNVSPLVMSLRERLFGRLRPGLIALASGVAIVLLITCANVSSVMLARSTARSREIGIRRALGASQSRLARQVLLENGLLSAAGASVGVLAGLWAVRFLLTLVPEDTPPWVQLDANLGTVLFGVSAAAFTALTAGLAPLLQTVTADARESLGAQSSGRASATRGQRRTLDGLVIAEIALACVLLVGGGLLMRAYHRLQSVDPGFNPENVLSFHIALPDSKYSTDAARRRFFETTVEELRRLPGVQHAGAITCPPLTCHWGNFLDIENAPARRADAQDPVILMRIATPGYDRALGLRVRRGRFLTDHDLRPKAPRAVVVNEAFVRTFYAGQDPIGRRVKFRGDTTWMNIVGVTQDVKHYGLNEPMRPGLYLPQSTAASSSMALLIRVAGDPMTMATPAREVVRRLDPQLPLYNVRTMSELLHNSLGLQRTYSWMLAVFAAIALALAIGGIYGVLSYVVGQRRREISIRLAMGAQRSSVLALVLRHGARLAGVGTIIGVGAALLVARLLTRVLYGVEPFDVLTYGTVIAALVITALLAASAPARRALAVEPQAALRE
ncbi:MAG: ABC transporter permease [Longimicrobiales bacterium]